MRTPIRVKHTMERLANHSGLINVGALLNTLKLKDRLSEYEGIHFTGSPFSHSDIIFSMIGLIIIGKPDYDAIEIFRSKSDFFTKALGLSGCPASPTIRQHLNLIGQAAEQLIKEESAILIKSSAPTVSPIHTSAGPFVLLDIDVSPFDKSKTKKEGVSRTYKGCDGYAPIFAYIGAEGYLANLEFREGKQHCQKHTPRFICNTLDFAHSITDQPVLIRLDSVNDSRENFPDQKYGNVQFIIKRNWRKEAPQAWAGLARKIGTKRL